MEELEAKFLQYDFEGDSRWQDFLNSFDFFGNDHKTINKLRRKFFKKYVEPDFDVSPSTSSQSPQSNDYFSTHPSPQEEPMPPIPEPSHSTTPESNTSNPPPPSRTTSFLQTAWSFGNILSLFGGVLYALSLVLGPSLGLSGYRFVFMGSATSYMCSLVGSRGFPKFNMRNITMMNCRQWLKDAAVDDNFQYLFFLLIFLMPPPSLMVVVPLVAMSGYWVAHLFAKKFPNNSITRLLRDKVLSSVEPLKYWIANWEVIIAFWAFINILGGNLLMYGLLCYVYSGWLRTRYLMSPYTKEAFRQWAASFDGWTQHNACPTILRTVYLKIRGFISSMGEMPNPNQPNGGGGNPISRFFGRMFG